MAPPTPLATLGALVLGLSAPMGPLNAQAATGEPTDKAFAWSERGVFVFRNATFDFQEQKLAFHFGSEKLLDCSDSEYFCLDGGPFALSLPRSCDAAQAALDKGQWTHNGNVIRVLGKSEMTPSLHLALEPVYVHLLQNTAHPEIVYEYVPDGGVRGLSYDVSTFISGREPADFAKAVKDSTYRARKGKDWSHSDILTFDYFGACQAT